MMFCIASSGWLKPPRLKKTPNPFIFILALTRKNLWRFSHSKTG